MGKIPTDCLCQEASRVSLQDVKAAARGRWPEVLVGMGIDRDRLTNRHGPCPVCWGTDRFRFDDKDGEGTWYCNQCGAGDGLGLVAQANGWDVSTAVKTVGDWLGVHGKPAPRQPDNRAWLRRMLKECQPGDHVADYINSRGLSTVPGCLKFHPALPYQSDGKDYGTFPAMLAVVHGANGSAQGIHRTYLADVATRKKLTSPVKSYTGGAIQLFEAAEKMAIAEGIETAIAVHEIAKSHGRDLPVWAAGNATLMRMWQPPDCVKHVVIAADNDANYAGHSAAYGLAHKLAAKGIRVDVNIPPNEGDWLDWWRK